MSTGELGLRELKRRMTRDSIADAALQLTLEHGLANLTIEEIARVAFVSPRTVSNYFAQKEEAVVAAGTGETMDMIEAFGQRPIDEPPLESLCLVLSDYLHSIDADELRLGAQKMQLVDDNPTLRPFQVAQYAELEETVRLKVAERTGTDLETDPYPWLVAGAAVSAANTAMRLWVKSETPPERLADFVQEAFTLISKGLPLPHHSSIS